MDIRRRINFTLIELLLVIAVIAVLVGMLLPALNSAREKVYTISCLSNLKQMGYAVEMYVNDHDYYPKADGLIFGDHKINSKGLTKAPSPFGPYIRNEKGLKCPTDNVDRGVSAHVPCSYGISVVAQGVMVPENGYVIKTASELGFGSDYHCKKVHIEKAKNGSSSFAVLGEQWMPGTFINVRQSDYYVRAFLNWSAFTGYRKSDAGETLPEAESRLLHGTGANYYWGDGHASFTPTSKLLAIKRSKGNSWYSCPLVNYLSK